MRIVLGLVALLASGLMAGAAMAAAPLDADCIWNAVPQARQQAMLADYRRQGAASRMRPTEGEFQGVISACNIAQADQVRTRAIVAGRFMRWAAETIMQERHGVDAGRLEAAWNAVPEAQRKEVGEAAYRQVTGEGGENPVLVIALSSFVDFLKAPDAAIGDAAFYFIGRAVVEEAAGGEQVA